MLEGMPLTEVSPGVWSNGHLRFDPLEGKIAQRPAWEIRLASSGQDAMSVGQIRFHGLWREYVLFTSAGYVFACDCLQDIAQFCRDRTKEWSRSNTS
jgi:hypothetical protein